MCGILTWPFIYASPGPSLPQELGMLEYELLTFRPSHIASAAVLLAKLYTNETQGIK